MPSREWVSLIDHSQTGSTLRYRLISPTHGDKQPAAVLGDLRCWCSSARPWEAGRHQAGRSAAVQVPLRSHQAGRPPPSREHRRPQPAGQQVAPTATAWESLRPPQEVCPPPGRERRRRRLGIPPPGRPVNRLPGKRPLPQLTSRPRPSSLLPCLLHTS